MNKNVEVEPYHPLYTGERSIFLCRFWICNEFPCHLTV